MHETPRPSEPTRGPNVRFPAPPRRRPSRGGSQRLPAATLAAAVIAALTVSSAETRALQQPDGTIIPQGNGLQDMFNSRGESIDVVNDAAIVPETFVPSCSLTFEVLQRNAGYMNAFGWYNVTGSAPSLADLHQVLSCTDGVGTSHTVDIANDPAYLGGEVGFFQAVGGCASVENHDYIFYSERQYNPDGVGPNVYTHLLIYNSTVVPRAFYFGWEDLLSGGDNDFDDLTTFVTGITCSGGGAACDTGALGICAAGTLQCQSGQLACVPSNASGPEVCDGLDNDCDGVVDNDAPCPGIEVCDRGVCVPPCTDVEFPCHSGLVCENGLCVDPACVGVDCGPGLRCEAGSCVEPCTGVQCPYGQVCRVGQCVDPCASLTCDTAQLCVSGVCVDHCDCVGCAQGETCQADGSCLPTPCVGNTCLPSQYCAPDGTCVDRCQGATCPAGQRCEDGQCVEVPPGPDGGVPPTDAWVPNADAAASDGGGGGPDGGGGGGGAQGGCDCRTPGAGTGASGPILLLLVTALLWRLRRRRDRVARS